MFDLNDQAMEWFVESSGCRQARLRQFMDGTPGGGIVEWSKGNCVIFVEFGGRRG
jgi:hypothetical protein